MTETQRRFLTEYLGECWHEMKVVDYNGTVRYQTMECYKCGCICNVDLPSYHRAMQRTFTTIQDKQDLLEAIIRKNEWYSVVWDMNGELMESQSGEFAGFKNYAKSFLFALSDSNESFTIKLIQLSPLETAELICKWKGVE
jgi:hypothetical protein